MATRAAVVVMMVGLALTIDQPSGAQSRTDPFVLAILGDNDALLPFASFDGERWRKNWPEPVEDGNPKLIAPERIPRAWWGGAVYSPVWEVVDAGGRRNQVRIVGSDWSAMGSSCATNVGLRIDAPKNTYKAGGALATSRPGAVEPITALTPESREWKRLRALLPGMFRRHVGPSADEPTLVKMLAASEGNGQDVYFEASRWRESFMTGWLRSDSPQSSLVTIAIETGVRDGDGKGMDEFQPLGIVRNGERRFWIGYLGSYAYPGLTVIDVRRNWITVHLRADYAGC